MKLHNYGKVPGGLEHHYSKVTELCDTGRLLSLEIDEAWYWYTAWQYGGSGQLLMRKNDLFVLHNMEHDSCHGPVSYAVFNHPMSLAQLKASCSLELFREVEPLFAMAERGGRVKSR